MQGTTSIGRTLMIVGVIALAAAMIIGFVPSVREYDHGALPAVGFFFILLGMALLFPDMLQDDTKSVSTMRVVVFMLVSVFVIVAIKIGWQAPNFDDFKIDRTWVYILGLTLGSKVFQSFSEGMDGQATVAKKDRQPWFKCGRQRPRFDAAPSPPSDEADLCLHQAQ